jgi:hypothetical protein
VVIPPDLLAKVVQEGLTAGELFAQGKLETVAVRAGLTKTEILPQLKQAEIGDKRKALVGELAPLVAQEWGVDPQLSPSAAVAVVLGPWVFASVSAFFTLARLAEEKARRGSRPQDPNASQP